MSRPVHRKPGESGFALLLVFLMAGIIAITLYMQIPRVAFQTQRQKEQLLIERGEQYKRAIQLFVRANNRYPGDLKDLEDFNHRRFLRHKFVDPMTGTTEWRLIHVNNGVFTDSILNKKKTDPNQHEDATTANSYVGVQPAIGESPQPGQSSNPGAIRRRPSEGGVGAPTIGPDGQPISTGQPGIPGALPVSPQPADQNPDPSQSQPVTAVQNPGGQMFAGQMPGQPFPPPGAQPNPYPGQPFPGAATNPGAPTPPELLNQPGLNPSTQPNVTAPFPGQQNPGMPFQGRPPGLLPLAPNNSSASPPTSSYVGGNQPYVGGSQPYVGGGAYIGSTAPSTPAPITNPTPFNQGQFNPQPAPNPPPVDTSQFNPQPAPSQPSFPNTPMTPGAPAAPGFPGNAGPAQVANPGMNLIQNILTNPRPAPGAQTTGGGQTFGGGGIAGVASKSENAAIMVYNDRTNYNEWEFIFDFTKQRALPNPLGGGIGTPASALGTVPGVPVGANNTSPVATPSATSGIGANPNTPGAPGIPGQTPPGQNPALPPNIRPGRP